MSLAPQSPRLHHVGLVVQDRDQLLLLIQLLGLDIARTCFVPEYDAECVFTTGRGASIELILPRGGKLARFNRGAGGLHHLALEVDDIAAAAEALGAQGIRLLESTPVEAGPLKINFLPPAYTRGVIVELVQSRVPASLSEAAT